MRFILFTLFILTLCFSCNQNVEKPKTLLSETEMSDILTDIYQYKQTSDAIPLTPEASFDLYISVFHKYGTTKEIFQNSFIYYYANNTEMQSIYDKTIDNLKSKLSKEQLQKIQEQEKTQEQEDAQEEKQRE